MRDKLAKAKGVFWGLIFGMAFWLIIVLLFVEVILNGG